MPTGTTLIGFADDVAMVVVAKGEQVLMHTANTALQRAARALPPKESYQIPWRMVRFKLVFAEHINKTVEKAEKTLTALSILMPNIGGPRASKRRLISSVMHSQILYAAPVLSTVANNANLVKKLNRVQRLMAIRISSAYRTISGEAAGVIAGIPPTELLIKERAEV
ncbi:hypothetical protein NQ317_001069 [Molorchus minor]|uniref:Reverse transcriptase domain-containing protein n=1 Tax=Molorchus minor TaxID=1323400 RepID=A0ABQ9IQJ7_9CUCU|nr:hypothetical protein NQ317_001069 [Molorchus minor]